MSWRQNNGRDRGHIDGIGTFLEGPAQFVDKATDDLDMNKHSILQLDKITGAIDSTRAVPYKTIAHTELANFLRFSDGSNSTNSAIVNVNTISNSEGNLNIKVLEYNGSTKSSLSLKPTGIDISGNTDLSGNFTIGKNGSGYDVKFYGDAVGKSISWNETSDTFIVNGESQVVGNLFSTGKIIAGGDISGNNLFSTGNITTATGNISGGNITASGTISGNLTGDTGNVTGVTITAAGNITATTGNISAGGDLTGNNIIIPTKTIKPIATSADLGKIIIYNNDLYLCKACFGFSTISAGYTLTSGLSSSGTVYCWGDNTYGQLGNGLTSVTPTPTPGQVVGVGGTNYLKDIVYIASGRIHTGAINNLANVYCWGNNDYGKLGNGNNTQSSTPIKVLGPGGTGFLSNIREISLGEEHTTAVNYSNFVYCWGLNDRGQLGNGTNTTSSTPVQVLYQVTGTALGSIIAISAGSYHNCALDIYGIVYCWGEGNWGQCGDARPTINGFTSGINQAKAVVNINNNGSLNNIKAISAGYTHTCALDNNGNVYSWGDNSVGQLGDNTFNTGKSIPVKVVGVGGQGFLSNIVAISAGSRSTCALDIYGNVYCWGQYNVGQLGAGSSVTTNSPSPVRAPINLPSGSFIKYISTKGDQVFAISNLGVIYGWGYNASGQLGPNVLNISPIFYPYDLTLNEFNNNSNAYFKIFIGDALL